EERAGGVARRRVAGIVPDGVGHELAVAEADDRPLLIAGGPGAREVVERDLPDLPARPPVQAVELLAVRHEDAVRIRRDGMGHVDARPEVGAPEVTAG